MSVLPYASGDGYGAMCFQNRVCRRSPRNDSSCFLWREEMRVDSPGSVTVVHPQEMKK